MCHSGSEEANKRLIRRYIEEVVNTGDVDALAEFVLPDCVEVHNDPRYAIGLEGARRHVLGVRETYPDLHPTIDHQIVEGEWVVTVVTVRGTHLGGTWLGLEPTGKHVVIAAINADRVVDGRIVEHGGAADLLEPLLVGGVRLVKKMESADSSTEPK